MEEFDYVVVGGGSAGCVVASRLSENPKVSVCLLEAGGKGNNWLVKAPIGIAIQVTSKTNNWAFETVPQPGLPAPDAGEKTSVSTPLKITSGLVRYFRPLK